MSSPHQETEEPITYINVVPMVDIMLVLLIVFMLTANFIASPSLPISAPKSYTAESTAPASRALVLTKTGQLSYRNKAVTETELREILKGEAVLNPDLRVVLSADAGISHGEVVKLIDLVRQAGVTKIALGVVR